MRHAICLLAVMLLITGCTKDDRRLSGTITLTSELYKADNYYYALGLSFAEGKAVPTLPDADRADISLGAGPVGGGSVVAYFSANTYRPPFGLEGDYAGAAEARKAFDNLKSVGSYNWEDMAYPLAANQVWVMKTRDAKYAKMRIIRVTLETREGKPFASCELEWAWQPDGSPTFP